MHPAVVAFSAALPLAQNTLLLKLDFLKVGHPGHRHSLVFSWLSGTKLPKLPINIT
jgi:hypothetical protein